MNAQRAFLLLMVVLLTACLPETQQAVVIPPSVTASITPSPTVTGTIIWFPPTATFTPFATREIQPTPEMHPGLGDLLASDDFNPPGDWQTARSENGSMAYGVQELTLAVARPKGTLLSLRSSPQVSDFYLEIDAYPSLCRTADMYGVLLRASSGQDFYRLLVNCQGELRMERLKDGQAVLLQDWTPSGQIQPGALLRSRLGVWALRNELRVFVNDVFQFAVRDPVWTSGQIGVFARAAGDTPLTVNFSNLSIRAIDAARVPTLAPTVTLTPVPSATRRPTATTAP